MMEDHNMRSVIVCLFVFIFVIQLIRKCKLSRSHSSKWWWRWLWEWKYWFSVSQVSENNAKGSRGKKREWVPGRVYLRDPTHHEVLFTFLFFFSRLCHPHSCLTTSPEMDRDSSHHLRHHDHPLFCFFCVFALFSRLCHQHSCLTTSPEMDPDSSHHHHPPSQSVPELDDDADGAGMMIEGLCMLFSLLLSWSDVVLCSFCALWVGWWCGWRGIDDWRCAYFSFVVSWSEKHCVLSLHCELEANVR